MSTANRTPPYPLIDVFDSGPNWIHGTDDNPILDLAKQTNTLLHDWDERMALFDRHGHLLPFEDAQDISESFWTIIGEAFKFSNDNSATIPVEQSLWDYIKSKADDIFTDLPFNEANEKRANLLRMSEMWGAFIGGSVHTQSLKFFWLEECIEGSNPFCAETYQKILNRIAEPALSAKVIQYGRSVVQIATQDSSGVPQVQIKTADGGVEYFDEVVVTAPLGWLKKNRDAFQPSLSGCFLKAVDSIGYGSLDKVGQNSSSRCCYAPT
jgi:hypothetical protein